MKMTWFTHPWVTVCVLAAFLRMGGSARAEVAVSGEFSLDHPVMNTVVFAPGRTEMFTMEAFIRQVREAHAIRRGGVVGFDAPKDEVTHEEIRIPYAQQKVLILRNQGVGENPEPRGQFLIGAQESDRTAASGRKYLGKHRQDSYYFTLELTGDRVERGESVVGMGFVVLSRESRDYRVGLRVRFRNVGVRVLGVEVNPAGTPVPGPHAIQIDEAEGRPEVPGERNTFFLVLAPPGDAIEQVEIVGREWSPGGDWYSGIDNLSFITAVPPPTRLP